MAKMVDFMPNFLASALGAATASAPRFGKREEIRAKIAGYANLPVDWDGDDGFAPEKEDIENAISFIEHIPPAALASVRTIVAGDGDVGFRWDGELDIEIGFMDGNISFYGYTPDGGRIGATQKCERGKTPEKLEQLFAAVFSG